MAREDGDQAPSPFRAARVVAFLAIGAVLYAALLAAAEVHVRRTGDGNPIHRIVTSGRDGHDWIVLGASHAMPLDFQDFGTRVENETGMRVLNLAAPGTGPLYHRFVAQRYFAGKAAEGVLIVVDSFGFYDERWNEGRFGDRDLLARTPLEAATLRLFAGYLVEGVDPRALLDYAAGFSKINNHDRFEPDIWEGETRFDRVVRPSDTADAERIDYLFPRPPDAATRARYLDELMSLVALTRAQEARPVVIKMPVPARFARRLPDEGAFDAALRAALRDADVAFHDFSGVLPEPANYFDSDHLNRDGATAFLERYLAPVLTGADGP